MSNAIIIRNRLNWIDWAKFIAIAFVVFGHIPQERGGFPVTYIIQFHMPLFFFVSGFLTKKEVFNSQILRKYTSTLIIPYLIYNIIFYPYWITRHSIQCPDAGFFDYIRPIIGTLLLQQETAYSISLNGVTWFIAALLVMRLILSVSYRYKYGLYFIAFLGIADAIFYIYNDLHHIITDLPQIGFTKCLPFFFLGHLCKRKKIIKDDVTPRDLHICIAGISLSLLAYYLQQTNEYIYLYGIYFWIINITAISGIFSMCKLLNRIHHAIIDNISIGTIVIMGLHWMMIGITNYSLARLLHIQGGIVYPWYVALLLTALYMAILYPLIVLFKNKYPFMLGKKTARPVAQSGQ